MEKRRKKSIQEKVSELKTHIKKLNEQCILDSRKKAVIENDNLVDHSSDGNSMTCSPDDEMIVNITDLDLSNEETWLYIPEKSSKDEETAVASPTNGN